MATQTFVPTDDVFVSQAQPNTNFGTEESLFIGRQADLGTIFRTFLKFNVSSIPSTSTIDSAILSLFVYEKEASGSQLASINRTLSDFSEDTITFNNAPRGVATGISTDITDADNNSFIQFNITPLVRGWYNGSIPNTGLAIIGVENALSLIGFRSKEYLDTRFWPKLQVSFVEGIATILPEETAAIPLVGSYTSNPIILDGRQSVAFLIANTGIGIATALVQVSPDGQNWYNDSFDISIGLNQTTTAITSTPCLFARVVITSATGTTISVIPTTKET